MFKNMGGNIPGGSFPGGGGGLMGGNFPGGSFPDTIFCLVKKCMKFRRSVQVLL